MLGLAAAAALLGFVPGGTATASAASAPGPVGALYSSTVGVPGSVRAGTTVSLHTWYMERSRYSMAATDFLVSVWSGQTASEKGLSVSWLNPLTHRWQAVGRTGYSDFGLSLDSAPTHLTLAPGRWARIDFRITFGASTRPGTWHVEPNVPNGFVLLDAYGRPVLNPGYLSVAHKQDFTVTVHR
ncbi:hypothetical protein GXW83_31630 [Streptacidiphilus sp. PB12-B1b]|uniref:hypothetical protein n=1 Tax=Streptacidiphilus sp. PB12-B1b TaxID=2705012 RepID=UPI0015F99CF8|nr:hypothetical protein [Streptacidiphilus sp. PB12-B1b]QMU79583.1 hypothetical protein GXW83_31630 [Streptacidiphilus sp. PB12-B1b]